MAVSLQAVSSWNEKPTGLRRRYLEIEKASQTGTQTFLSHTEFSLPMSLDTALTNPIHGPNIEWNPSFSMYRERVRTLADLNIPRPMSVPEGFPNVVCAPWVWDGSDFKNEEYVLILSETDIVEIEQALAIYKGTWPPKIMLSVL
jgi:hypothetical protein